MVNSLFSRNLTFYKTLAEDTTNKNGIGVYIRDPETNKYVCHHTTDYNTILSDDFNQKVGESALRGQLYTALETISSYSERIKELGLFYTWSGDVNYSEHAIVRKNNTYWISLQDNNTNHDPEELNSEWWELFQIGGGGERKVGDVFWSDHLIHYENGETPRAIKADGSLLNLTLYPDFKDYLIKLETTNPDQFATDYASWEAEKNATKLGQIGKYCWGDANKQSVYLKSIINVTGYLDNTEDTTIQKQEVPTGTMTAMTLVNYMQLNGAFTASGEDGYTGGNGFTEIRGRNFTYDPQKAGDNTFATNGENVREESVKGIYYIQVMSDKTPSPTLFDFKGSVASVQDLPQASSNKSNIYLVDNATDGGLYLSDGSTWNLIMEPASIVNLTSLVNRVATLESLPHIIYSNYTVKPYYEVLSNGMCRQWSMADPSDTSSAYTADTTFSFAIPYKNTGYLLKNVGFDVRNVGEQLVTLSTTGFTTSSLRTASGTRCWEAYGEVDLEQISDYIL